MGFVFAVKFEHNPAKIVPEELLQYSVSEQCLDDAKTATKKRMSGIQPVRTVVHRLVSCQDPDNAGTTYSPINPASTRSVRDVNDRSVSRR